MTLSEDSLGPKRSRSLRVVGAVPVVAVVLLISMAHCLLIFPRLTTRFCFNSPLPAKVQSQCVYCNYYTFFSMVLGCTGSSAISVNITTNEAFCLITQCLGQIRQTPTFVGRKKRAIDGEEEKRDEVNGVIPLNGDIIKIPSESATTESVQFAANGNLVQFIVAQEVTADVYEPESDLIDSFEGLNVG